MRIWILLFFLGPVARAADETEAFHEFTRKVMDSSGALDPSQIKDYYDSTLGPVQRRREEDAAKTGKVNPKPLSGPPPTSSEGPALPSDQPSQMMVFTSAKKSSPSPEPKMSGKPPPSSNSPSNLDTGLGSLQSPDVTQGWNFNRKASPTPSK